MPACRQAAASTTQTVRRPAITATQVGFSSGQPVAPSGQPQHVTAPLCAAATVQCLPEGHFVLVVPRGLSAQPYNLDSVRLASTQPGCQPTQTTDAFVLFHFPVTQCGTTVQVGVQP